MKKTHKITIILNSGNIKSGITCSNPVKNNILYYIKDINTKIGIPIHTIRKIILKNVKIKKESKNTKKTSSLKKPNYLTMRNAENLIKEFREKIYAMDVDVGLFNKNFANICDEFAKKYHASQLDTNIITDKITIEEYNDGFNINIKGRNFYDNDNPISVNYKFDQECSVDALEDVFKILHNNVKYKEVY